MVKPILYQLTFKEDYKMTTTYTVIPQGLDINNPLSKDKTFSTKKEATQYIRNTLKPAGVHGVLSTDSKGWGKYF